MSEKSKNPEEKTEKNEAKLTPENEKFALIYVETGDKYKAYEMAGYEAKDRNVQASAVSRLLSNPRIQKRIEELKYEYAMAAGVTEERILANLAEIGFDKANNKSDRNRALELLGKSRGMWTDVIKNADDKLDELSKERIKQAKEAARMDVERLGRQSQSNSEAERQRVIKMSQGGDVI